jgi:predicted house-cleaning NTP pyrophosphatase (Maf/HAM1 superfamily)
MSSVKEKLEEENLADTSILIDAVTTLINSFKQAGYNPPTSIRVDKQTFDKLLEEASQLYSSINVKDSITNHEFSIASITNIVLEEEKNEDINEYHDSEKQQKDQQQLAREHQEQQHDSAED